MAATIQAETGRALTVGDVFKNAIFRNIILSLLATLGLYIIASIIFVSLFSFFFFSLLVGRLNDFFSLQFEPWHMITSFVQYLLMAPSYIGVLNVYAVCVFLSVTL